MGNTKLRPTVKPSETKMDEGQKFLNSCLRSTKAYRPPYLTPRDEANLNITIVPWDLQSGNAPDRGPRFIRPLPRDKMYEFLQRERPWETYELGPYRGWDPETAPDKGYRWHEGLYMLLALQEAMSIESNCPLWFGGNWQDGLLPCSIPFPFRLMCPYDSQSWNFQFFASPVDDCNPHANVFFTDGEPLRAGSLSTGELAMATAFMVIRRCLQGYDEHRYLPVTVFSACDRQIRLVQFWHDREEPRAIHVRRSPIIEILGGEVADMEDWVTILCWALGEQVEEDKDDATGEQVGGGEDNATGKQVEEEDNTTGKQVEEEDNTTGKQVEEEDNTTGKQVEEEDNTTGKQVEEEGNATPGE